MYVIYIYIYIILYIIYCITKPIVQPLAKPCVQKIHKCPHIRTHFKRIHAKKCSEPEFSCLFIIIIIISNAFSESARVV